ncbi:MAG: hypothetical protein U1D30_19565 [Planctomycetota bacterium]
MPKQQDIPDEEAAVRIDAASRLMNTYRELDHATLRRGVLGPADVDALLDC